MSETARRQTTRRQTAIEQTLNEQTTLSGDLSSLDQIRSAADVIRQEASALARLADQPLVDIPKAVELILNCSGCVIVIGVGKAGWIGQKISASLASTGTRSHFLHPAEAMHGDLGRVSENDVILVFSNSGETAEIVCLLPTLAKLKTPIVSVTSKVDSTLATHSQAVLDYGATKEACPLGLAPTTSTTMMLAMGDALTLVLSRMRKFMMSDFAKFHPGGSLGKKLSMVDDVMRSVHECRVATQSETVREVYVRLGGRDRRAGAVLVVDDHSGRLVGIFTDSDLAKLLEQQLDHCLDSPIKSVMTKSPVSIPIGSKTTLAVETLACRNLSELPVVDAKGKPLGIVEITDVVGVTTGWIRDSRDK
jgi:arabinose-5-phosphate isomerase